MFDVTSKYSAIQMRKAKLATYFFLLLAVVEVGVPLEVDWDCCGEFKSSQFLLPWLLRLRLFPLLPSVSLY